MRGVLWVSLVACGSGPEDEGPISGITPTADTASDTAASVTSGPAGAIAASCVVAEDNVLRYVCDVRVDPPGPVEVAFQPEDGGGPPRVHRSDAVVTDHTVTLWRMAPRTAYSWTATAVGGEAREATGRFETGEAPEGARVLGDVLGTPTFPYVLVASPCSVGAVVVVMSTAGDVVWYHDFAERPGEVIRAASFTEDGTVLALVGERIAEVDLLGGALLNLAVGTDFAHSVHHDVFRKDARTYALFEETVEWQGYSYLLDGYYVFDADGSIGTTWRLFEHFQPPDPSDAIFDYSHMNSLFVDDAGDVYLSMRNISALAKVSGSTGEILWRLSGDPGRSPFGSDFTLTSAVPDVLPSFQQQHNLNLLPDGRFALFDNRIVASERSRVLVVALDGNEARIEEAYRLPQHCPFQGSAWHTAGGNPVGGCAPSRVGFEFDAGASEPRWSMGLRCLGGGNNAVPRFVPMEEADLRP